MNHICVISLKLSIALISFASASMLHGEVSKPVSAGGMQAAAQERAAAFVRIPISLQPHEPVQIRAHDGTIVLQTKPNETLDFTLKGAINQPNQFYFANWRVETEPILWKQDVREYATRLSIYKTYGEQHELEESIGNLELKGYLVAESDKIFSLVGQKTAEFKTLEGNLKLIVKAGQPKIDQVKPALVTKLEPINKEALNEKKPNQESAKSAN